MADTKRTVGGFEFTDDCCGTELTIGLVKLGGVAVNVAGGV